ncbi:PREDICTED: uncharacterized protein LOC105454652 [Wasmannia auropunctata]|uniref:uncharacterized protein LOC105454652 n=1 Tax=Wasmannia auropunctata TaxID=64793 RepID=UPI0005EF1E76|nr:PREDICTED: uncharacterized protein LOC105454652 [Wasmannia auropunctata]
MRAFLSSVSPSAREARRVQALYYCATDRGSPLSRRTCLPRSPVLLPLSTRAATPARGRRRIDIYEVCISSHSTNVRNSTNCTYWIKSQGGISDPRRGRRPLAGSLLPHPSRTGAYQRFRRRHPQWPSVYDNSGARRDSTGSNVLRRDLPQV